MSGAREAILGSIRRSLGREGPFDEEMVKVLDARLAAHETHVKPAFQSALADRFVAKLEAVAVSVARVPSLTEVPQAVTAHLDRYSLPYEMVMSGDPVLSEIRWPNELSMARRAATRDDRIGITGAFAAVAETGSLVLISGPASPTTLNFLPEDHIAVVGEDQILPHIEDVWSQLREQSSGMPRTLNFITGPSKTADVEQTIQIGAHGPRRVHVVLAENSSSPDSKA